MSRQWAVERLVRITQGESLLLVMLTANQQVFRGPGTSTIPRGERRAVYTSCQGILLTPGPPA
jgi:hypothetical protein